MHAYDLSGHMSLPVSLMQQKWRQKRLAWLQQKCLLGKTKWDAKQDVFFGERGNVFDQLWSLLFSPLGRVD